VEKAGLRISVFPGIHLGDHLSRRCVTAPLQQPTRDWLPSLSGSAFMETSNLPPSADDFVPAWPCSRRGLPGRVYYYTRRWSFTPPFHPDPAFADRAVCFLWPFSGRLAPNGGVPAPGAIRRRALWSADFPRSRLARPRPPDQPDTISSYPIHLIHVNTFTSDCIFSGRFYLQEIDILLASFSIPLTLLRVTAKIYLAIVRNQREGFSFEEQM
jgi:hypothetical protein